ncbi:MAG: CBS domain-containing protein [Allosphingosinicella sp.]
MQVRDIMTHAVRSVGPTETISYTAALMADIDVGALPVVDDGTLVGIVTDRDLAVRGLAVGVQGGAPVFRVMTREVITCDPDDQVSALLKVMREQQIRRVPVCCPSGDLIGIVTIGDTARCEEYAGEVLEALVDVCRPHGRHCQALRAA